MREVWGDRLLSAPVREKGHNEQDGVDSHVRLEELGSKIAVIVEYHLPDEANDSPSDSSSSSSSDSEDEKQAQEEYKARKKAAVPTIIIPELAELGIYAQSVKPGRDTSWYTSGKPKDGPDFHLINMSESGLASHLDRAAEIARHNSHHLMRVFPKGTRISSRNLSPVPFWAIGAHIAALNWQSFGASMQLNDALFAGTAGYVLKPDALRSGGSGVVSRDAPRRVLRLRVAGATDVPLPKSRKADDPVKPYLTCSLVQPGGGAKPVTCKRKTTAYHPRKGLSLPLLGLVAEAPIQTDPIWDETLEWEYNDDQLVFLRMLVKSDDSFSSNPVLAVTAVRLLYVESGWRFVRLLNLRGGETGCSVLVNFEIQDV